jgi:hypothetical protein
VIFKTGDINLDISTIGYAFNLEKFKAVMDPFYCRGEVLNWNRLIWLIEKHFVSNLIKNSATISFSKMFGFNSNSNHNNHSSNTNSKIIGSKNIFYFNKNEEKLMQQHLYENSNNNIYNKLIENDVDNVVVEDADKEEKNIEKKTLEKKKNILLGNASLQNKSSDKKQQNNKKLKRFSIF